MAEENSEKADSAGEKGYSQYLQGRSFKGYLYRRWLLYPRIARYLDGKVLDFGCGIGDFLSYRRNAVGVDSNSHNVDVCVRRGLAARQINGRWLPFSDGSFSSAVMDNVIEHIPCYEAADVIQELLRVLIPGGVLLIGIPGAKGYATDEDHKCFYSENDLVGLMETFACIRLRSIHAPFYFPLMSNYLRQYCVYVFFRTPFEKDE